MPYRLSRSQEAIESTFVMSNVIPQKTSINSGSWARLERQVRSWACGEEAITVITGPVLTDALPKLKSGVSIPNEFFKIIVDDTPPKKSISFIFEQSLKGRTLINRQTLKSKIEALLPKETKFPEDSTISQWKTCQ